MAEFHLIENWFLAFSWGTLIIIIIDGVCGIPRAFLLLQVIID